MRSSGRATQGQGKTRYMQTKHKIPNKRAHTHKLKKGMQGGGAFASKPRSGWKTCFQAGVGRHILNPVLGKKTLSSGTHPLFCFLGAHPLKIRGEASPPKNRG